MNIVNLTPHNIHFYHADGRVETIIRMPLIGSVGMLSGASVVVSDHAYGVDGECHFDGAWPGAEDEWTEFIPLDPKTAYGARASMTEHEVGFLSGDGVRFEDDVGPAYRMVAQRFGSPTGLPAPRNGIYLVVSRITAEAARASGRTTDDLLLTADLVRDDQGRIIGCKAFTQLDQGARSFAADTGRGPCRTTRCRRRGDRRAVPSDHPAVCR